MTHEPQRDPATRVIFLLFGAVMLLNAVIWCAMVVLNVAHHRQWAFNAVLAAAFFIVGILALVRRHRSARH